MHWMKEQARIPDTGYVEEAVDGQAADLVSMCLARAARPLSF